MRLLVLAALAAPAAAQCLEGEIPIAQNTPEDAMHGAAVAVAGDLAVIGAPNFAPLFQSPRGLVTLAEWDGAAWTPDTLLVPGTIDAGDEFGASVAIAAAGDVIAVGAPGDDAGGADAGRVLIYEAPVAAWQVQLQLVGAAAGDRLGASVDADGDVVVAGMPGANGGAGGALVIRRSAPLTWSVEQALSPPSATAGDAHGAAVGVGGEWIVVGAPGEDDGVTDAGAVEFLEHDAGGWTSRQYLPGTRGGAALGSAVAIDGGLALAGAPLHDAGATDRGRAHFFALEAGAWSRVLETNENAKAGARYGAAVAIDGAVAVVGQPGAPKFGADAGLATLHLWNGSAWSTGPAVTSGASWGAPSPDAGEEFGAAVAVDGNRVIVGAPLADAGPPADRGEGHSYDLAGGGSFTDLRDGLAGFGGATPALAGSGPLVPNAYLGLSLTDARPASTATLLLGATAIDAPFKGGILVPAPDLLIPGLPTGPLGALEIAGFVPGGLGAFDLYLQSWVVDPDGPQGLAASNALLAQVLGP